jgi:hypothetical protein
MIAKAKACGLFVDDRCVESVNKPQPNPLDTIYNSQTVWYKIAGLGDYVRPMGSTEKESAASTAVTRLENKSSKYQAPNLDSFLKNEGAVTPVP